MRAARVHSSFELDPTTSFAASQLIAICCRKFLSMWNLPQDPCPALSTPPAAAAFRATVPPTVKVRRRRLHMVQPGLLHQEPRPWCSGPPCCIRWYFSGSDVSSEVGVQFCEHEFCRHAAHQSAGFYVIDLPIYAKELWEGPGECKLRNPASLCYSKVALLMMELLPPLHRLVT